MGAREAIEAGKTTIGIEFGSTNIKAVLIGEDFKVLAFNMETKGYEAEEKETPDHGERLRPGKPTGGQGRRNCAARPSSLYATLRAQIQEGL